MVLAHTCYICPGSEASAMKMKIRWPFVLKWHSPKVALIMISLSDYIWRRCPWLRQGTKKQISNQKVFCEASPNGLPASADCVRGGQHGNVSSGGSKADSLIHIWTPPSQIPSFTPKCKQSLKISLSFNLLQLEKIQTSWCSITFFLDSYLFQKSNLILQEEKNTVVQIALYDF